MSFIITYLISNACFEVFPLFLTGIDAAEEGIQAAIEHSKLSPTLSNNLTYHCTTIEQHSANNLEKYDAMVLSEVLEHVPSVSEFVTECGLSLIHI